MQCSYRRGIPVFTRLLTILVLASGLLSACGGESGSPGDTSDAARDNVDAMSREHADDNGKANAAADEALEREIIAETLPYAEVGEQLVYGHFVFPADMVEPLPAVIVIHEWWGLNDGVRAMANRLAAQGYIVLAVDLFAGEATESPAGARELMLRVVEKPEPARENLRQAYDFISNTAGAPRIAALGWCFGGGWALNTAMLFPTDLDAAVIYYGQVTDDDERLRPVDVPLLGIFAEQDRGIPLESVRNFEAALTRLRKDFELHVYPGVGHAFANPSGNNYHPERAAEAWTVTLDFLNRHLSAPSD